MEHRGMMEGYCRTRRRRRGGGYGEGRERTCDRDLVMTFRATSTVIGCPYKSNPRFHAPEETGKEEGGEREEGREEGRKG